MPSKRLVLSVIHPIFASGAEKTCCIVSIMRALLLNLTLLALSSTTLVASTLPDLDLQDLKGGHHKLADYKGKVVLLNFWATWCVPCASEMPLLGEMQKQYKGKVVVIAASIDDPLDRNKLEPFLRKHKARNLKLMVGPRWTRSLKLGWVRRFLTRCSLTRAET